MTEEQKKKEAMLKQKQSIAKLDQQLKDIDLKAVIEIRQLNFTAVQNLSQSGGQKQRSLMQV